MGRETRGKRGEMEKSVNGTRGSPTARSSHPQRRARARKSACARFGGHSPRQASPMRRRPRCHTGRPSRSFKRRSIRARPAQLVQPVAEWRHGGNKHAHAWSIVNDNCHFDRGSAEDRVRDKGLCQGLAVGIIGAAAGHLNEAASGSVALEAMVVDERKAVAAATCLKEQLR